VLLAACGRLGFAPESYDIDPSRGRDAAVPGDGDGDGDGDDGTPGDGDADSGPLPGDGDGDIDAGVMPVDDGGVEPMQDAAMPEPDAGEPFFYPLPRSIACADYAGVLACDDQAGEQAGAPVTTFEEGGTISVEQGYAVATAPGEGGHLVLQSEFGPFTTGEVYLRFSLYIPSSVDIRGLNIATIGTFDSSTDFGVDLNLEAVDSLELYATGDGARIGTTYAPPRDQWLCILFKVETIDATNGRARIFVDGQERLDVGGIDTLPPGGITAAAAGIDWTYDGQVNTTLYMKNFLVTRAHPGNCP
jgi:hypothetical protein